MPAGDKVWDWKASRRLPMGAFHQKYAGADDAI